jgi:hypothetical protein
MPTASKKNYQIPFNVKGDLMSYEYHGAIMKDNFEFSDTLTYNGYGRGRSAASLYFTDAKGITYSMFLSDFDDLMKTKKLIGDQVSGKWTFVKKGSNYGIKFLG